MLVVVVVAAAVWPILLSPHHLAAREKHSVIRFRLIRRTVSASIRSSTGSSWITSRTMAIVVYRGFSRTCSIRYASSRATIRGCRNRCLIIRLKSLRRRATGMTRQSRYRRALSRKSRIWLVRRASWVNLVRKTVHLPPQRATKRLTKAAFRTARS
uniref:Putative secreted protein n=1 Tax=Anopheles triannulatus TaxID=58253 RepID=A0A2M4B168_9DIPT